MHRQTTQENLKKRGKQKRSGIKHATYRKNLYKYRLNVFHNALLDLNNKYANLIRKDNEKERNNLIDS